MQIRPNIEQPNKMLERRKVIASSIAGSALGIATSVVGIYAMAKKGNPALAFKNFAYSEKDVLLIGAGSVIGGLAGGLISDKNKNNVVPKLREASQQFVGSTLIPVSLLSLGNKLLEKTNFQLPQISSTSKPAKVANAVLKVLPKVAMTFAALFGGMQIGNRVVNKVNNKIFNENVNRSVAPEDMFVHTDDLCLATSMLLKGSPAVSSATSVILPVTFLLSGAKTGIQQKENC